MLKDYAELRTQRRATAKERNELLLAHVNGTITDQEHAKSGRSPSDNEGMGEVGAVAQRLDEPEAEPSSRAATQAG
jgi:hypothetical protein